MDKQKQYRKIHKLLRPTAQRSKQCKIQQTKLPPFSRLLRQSARKRRWGLCYNSHKPTYTYSNRP